MGYGRFARRVRSLCPSLPPIFDAFAAGSLIALFRREIAANPIYANVGRNRLR